MPEDKLEVLTLLLNYGKDCVLKSMYVKKPKLKTQKKKKKIQGLGESPPALTMCSQSSLSVDFMFANAPALCRFFVAPELAFWVLSGSRADNAQDGKNI